MESIETRLLIVRSSDLGARKHQIVCAIICMHMLMYRSHNKNSKLVYINLCFSCMAFTYANNQLRLKQKYIITYKSSTF